MATYKVLQDIEAEDKLLGPLTLRQFIYAAIAAVCLYLSYYAISKNLPFLLVIFLPPAIFTGFFAFPWGRDQPTEIWALAKIRFMLKPHRRIWNQSGVKELVTITAPKRVVQNYTDGLSQTEVQSRLQALADTIDSRGWAVKSVNVNLFPQASTGMATSDRLIDASSLPQQVESNLDIQASDDILDAINNPVAQHFNQMIDQSNQAHRQQIMQEIKQAQNHTATTPGSSTKPKQNNYWFMDQPQQTPKAKAGYVTFNPSVINPGTPVSDDWAAQETPEEKALAEKIKASRSKPEPAYAHLHVVQPISEQKAQAKVQPPKPKTPDPSLYELAQNNDLDVATLARQAKKEKEDDGEVVISLH